jgi:GxxExxY protein
MNAALNIHRGDAEARSFDLLSDRVIGPSVEIHRQLGPGLLESAYEECLCYELSNSQLQFERQKPPPVTYKNVKLDCGYRLDLVVENKLIVDLKTVEQLLPIHEPQLLTYLKLSRISFGLLINLNVPLLKQGIKRMVNKFPDSSASPRLGGSK